MTLRQENVKMRYQFNQLTMQILNCINDRHDLIHSHSPKRWNYVSSSWNAAIWWVYSMGTSTHVSRSCWCVGVLILLCLWMFDHRLTIFLITQLGHLLIVLLSWNRSNQMLHRHLVQKCSPVPRLALHSHTKYQDFNSSAFLTRMHLSQDSP